MKEKIKIQKGFIQIPALATVILIIISVTLSFLYFNENRKNNILESSKNLQRESDFYALEKATEQLNENLEFQRRLEEQKRQEEARLNKIEECKITADISAEIIADIAGKKARDAILAQYSTPSGENLTLTEQLNSLIFGLKFTTELAKTSYDDAHNREYARNYLIYYSNCIK